MGQNIREEIEEGGKETGAVQEAADRLARAGGWSRYAEGSPKKAGPMKLGAGLSAVPAGIVKKIRRGEYVDFAELPPAMPEEEATACGQSGDRVLIVQAADLRRTRRKIPDVMVWARCFILYVGVVAADEPGRITDLLDYMDGIVRSARKFHWPTCEEYDRRFRQVVAGDEARPWATMDPGLFAECFTSQARTGPMARDPGRGNQLGSLAGSRKRQRETAGPTPAEQDRAEVGAPVCQIYNRYQGDCKFGVRCRFQHVCSSCRGQHPVSKCDAGAKD